MNKNESRCWKLVRRQFPNSGGLCQMRPNHSGKCRSPEGYEKRSYSVRLARMSIEQIKTMRKADADRYQKRKFLRLNDTAQAKAFVAIMEDNEELAFDNLTLLYRRDLKTFKEKLQKLIDVIERVEAGE